MKQVLQLRIVELLTCQDLLQAQRFHSFIDFLTCGQDFLFLCLERHFSFRHMDTFNIYFYNIFACRPINYYIVVIY